MFVCFLYDIQSKANPNSAVQTEKYTTKIQVTPQPVNDNTKPAPENVNTNVSGQKPVASNDKTGNATTIISKEEQMRYQIVQILAIILLF